MGHFSALTYCFAPPKFTSQKKENHKLWVDTIPTVRIQYMQLLTGPSKSHCLGSRTEPLSLTVFFLSPSSPSCQFDGGQGVPKAGGQGARSPWDQTPATHSCSSPWPGNLTGMLRLSLSKVRMQCATPPHSPGGWWGCMECTLSGLGLPVTPGLGRRKHTRIYPPMCSDRSTCVDEHTPPTHTNTHTGSL